MKTAAMNAGPAAAARPPLPMPWQKAVGYRDAAARLRQTPPGMLPLAFALGVALALGALVVYAEVNALVVCVSLLGCLAILKDFRVGVLLLIVLLPISASPLMPRTMGGITGLNPLNLLLFSTLAACLVHLPRATLGRLAPRPLMLLYVAPIVIAGLIGSRHVMEIPSFFDGSNLLSFDSADGYLRDMLFKPMLMVLFAVAVIAAAARARQDREFHLALLLSVWAMAMLTITFVVMSGAGLSELASRRARLFLSPLGIHANDLGRLYAMAYALLLFTFAETVNYRQRMVLIASMLVLVVALILTFSRAAFVGFFVVNVWFLLSRRKLTLMILAGAVFAGFMLVLPDAVYQRLGSGWDAGLNTFSAGRIDHIWLPLLPELLDSPVYGKGLGSILWSQAMRNGDILQVTHPHNAYLQVALDMGALGLLLVCAFFLHIWKAFRRLGCDMTLTPPERGFYSGAAVGLVSFLLAGFTGSSLIPGLEQVFLWLAIGMMYGRALRGAETNSRAVTP